MNYTPPFSILMTLTEFFFALTHGVKDCGGEGTGCSTEELSRGFMGITHREENWLRNIEFDAVACSTLMQITVRGQICPPPSYSL